MSYKLCFLALALLLASTLGSKDPELKKCQQQCKDQTQYDKKEIQKCIQQYCHERHEGGGRGPNNPLDPPENDEREREEEKREGEGQNPYVFEERHFFTGKTKHGTMWTLQKFTERSKLLRGIENFRLTFSEGQPHTFLVPNHWDADGVLFVVNGKGRVSFMYQDRRESFNVKEGDIYRIRAGTMTYMINSDNKERFNLVGLLKPINSPGEFGAFFGTGGENPESFYKAFSNEILEAAFNTKSDKLKRLFGLQKQGAILKASEEQIRGLSGHGEGASWPSGGESKDTSKHSLYEQHTSQSNQYGQLYEVDSDQFRQLRDLDVAVSLANISKGAMMAPHYNSRATKIMTVVNGEGYFEMACPHLSRSQGSESQGQTRAGSGYQKIRSSLKTGTVVVVPAGHPFVAVASKNRNLKLLCFEINAYNNKKYTLAGKGNVMKQLEKEAKELAFGVAEREVDEVFNRQKDEFFLKGPRQQD